MLLQTKAENKQRIIQDRMRQESRAWRGGENFKESALPVSKCTTCHSIETARSKAHITQLLRGLHRGHCPGAQETEKNFPMTSPQKQSVTYIAQTPLQNYRIFLNFPRTFVPPMQMRKCLKKCTCNVILICAVIIAFWSLPTCSTENHTFLLLKNCRCITKCRYYY